MLKIKNVILILESWKNVILLIFREKKANITKNQLSECMIAGYNTNRVYSG